MRKLWKKPELIVLVRGISDERVLRGCKGSGPYNSGPSPDFQATPCLENGLHCGACNVAPV